MGERDVHSPNPQTTFYDPNPLIHTCLKITLITDPDMRICIYTWKLNQTERKLSRLNPTSSEYVELKEEIKLLTSSLESIKQKSSQQSAADPAIDPQSSPSVDDTKQIPEGSPRSHPHMLSRN